MNLLSLDPVSILEMLAAGYLIAAAVQMLLGFCYTRLGRNLLIVDDRWTATYFGLTGLSWIVAAAVAVLASLPIAEVPSKRLALQITAFPAVLLILVLWRNRRQRRLQQSIPIMLFYDLCITAGSTLGCLTYCKFLFKAK